MAAYFGGARNIYFGGARNITAASGQAGNHLGWTDLINTHMLAGEIRLRA